MHVVLDANTIISEGFGQSACFQFLLTSSSVVGHTICIPALAVDEVVAEFKRSLEHDIQQVGRDIGRVSRRIGRALYSPIADLDLEEEVSQFRAKLESQFRDSKCTILDYPDTSHKELVKRAVERRKPFDQNGSGYRDALIWESVLSLAASTHDAVMLVSSDNDFRDKEGNMHPELAKEVISRVEGEVEIRLIGSLSEFIDIGVRPNLKIVLHDKPSQTLALLGLNPEEAIALSFLEAYVDREWEPGQLGLSSEHETLNLSSVGDVYDLEVLEVREIAGGHLLLRGKATLECDFDVFVHKSDAFVMDDLTIIDFDWNNHYVLAEVNLPLRCELDLVIDTSGSEQHDVKVLSAETTSNKC